MANIGEGGGGNTGLKMVSKEILAAALAADLDRMTRRFVGAEWATVTNADWMASQGFVLATIGTHEVRVLCPRGSSGLAVGQEILVRRVSADSNTLWEYSGGGGSEATEYGLCFASPGTNTTGAVYVNWGGTIRDIQTTGTGTVSLAVGGVAVGEGDSVSAGDWLVATVSGGSGTYFAIAVVVS